MNGKLTIIFTNWRRKSNLKRIIDKTLQQTLQPCIVVIDNASFDDEHKFEYNHPNVKIIEKDNTLKCWERWLYAMSCSSEYICIMDDDLIFKNNDVLERCYSYMQSKPYIDCIGSEGVLLEVNKGYSDSQHLFSNTSGDINVDIIKGRFMFLRNSSLNKSDTRPDLTCDDIKISSSLDVKVLPTILFNCFENLNQGNESLGSKSYQKTAREYARLRYFK